jgi:RND family efflux transporter MFP subunit
MITLSGSVISDNQKMITSRFMGFVQSFNVSVGDEVKKGDLLYEIDSKEIDSAKDKVMLGVTQAELSLQMYLNQLNNVSLNLARNKRLLEKDMVSKFDVEALELAQQNLKNMVNIAQAQIDQAKSSLVQVENQYNYLKMRAPNDAVVVQTSLKAGEMAMPGMPAIILTDLSQLKIQTEISEKNLKQIRRGQRVTVEVPSMNLRTKGIVTAIIPSSNPMTHSFLIKVNFKTKGKRIYPGMYAKVHVK